MGTHPSGPARLLADEGTTLDAWLGAHPAALGDAARRRFGGDLPFLFKARGQTSLAARLLFTSGSVPPSCA